MSPEMNYGGFVAPNPDLQTSFVRDSDSEPPALVLSASRWLLALRWASSALIVAGGLHLGILLARGEGRVGLPAHWLWIWPPAIIGGLAWLGWLLCLLKLLRPLHALQQLDSSRPLRWPYWILPASLLIPPIGVLLLGRYLHAIFRATSIRQTAPLLHLGFWSVSAFKIVLLLCSIAMGAGMAWQRNADGMTEHWQRLRQPLALLDLVTTTLDIALCFWILVRVLGVFAGRLTKAAQ